MEILFHSVTHPGSREVNEDYIGGMKLGGGNFCFCLADGLGGHQCGEEASKMAVETFMKMIKKKKATLEEAFTAAQNNVMALQKKTGRDMKTTLTGMVLANGKVSFAHIGDSRIYHFRAGTLYTRTKDHSVPQILVSMGEIEESEIRFHPDRNRLLSVIGEPWERPRYSVDAVDLPLEDGDCFLLCSDGFWEYIDEATMETLLLPGEHPKTWLEKMLQVVNHAQEGCNADNYSAVVVQVRMKN